MEKLLEQKMIFLEGHLRPAAQKQAKGKSVYHARTRFFLPFSARFPSAPLLFDSSPSGFSIG
jgi:hypothetical protein